MSAILQTSSFIETEGCSGPNYIRNQKSRESPGILMTEIQDKYIPEFELPYRNVLRYIKEVENNWNKLDSNQRLSIINSFKFMNLPLNHNGSGGNGGGNGGSGSGNGRMENFVPDMEPSSGEVDNYSLTILFLKHLSTGPTNANDNQTKRFMDMIWNPTREQIEAMEAAGLTKQQLRNIRGSIQRWSADNAFILHSNWRSYSVLIALCVVIIGLIVLACFL